MKKSFLLYANYLQQIEMLDMAQRGELLTALLQYASGRPAEECCDGYNGVVMMAFSFIRAQIDRDADQYEKKCEKARESARKRWDANASKETGGNAKNANASKRMRTHPNVSESMPSHANAQNAMHNDNDNENDNEKEITHRVSNKEKANAHTKAQSLAGEKDNDVFTPPTPQEVEEYARECGNQIDAERFVNYYGSIGWKTGGNPITDWQAAARNWMHNQSPVKSKQPAPPGRQNFQNREIDYDGLLRMADFSRKSTASG